MRSLEILPEEERLKAEDLGRHKNGKASGLIFSYHFALLAAEEEIKQKDLEIAVYELNRKSYEKEIERLNKYIADLSKGYEH